MNNLLQKIVSVEEQWLDELYGFCREQFQSVKIPSHDHLHHLRVWHLAKELIVELTKVDTVFSRDEIEQIFIAIFFHDVGLIKTIDKKHGFAGREICEKYFRENHPDFDNSLDKILDAIEHHDDKEYKNMVYHGDMHKSILSILCVCDDLDAFGAIGVFRYMEIYMLRGVKVADLPKAILDNVSSRYRNFVSLFGHLETFHRHQEVRYEFIEDFYCQLDEELENSEVTSTFTDCIGVVNVFKEGIVSGTETIETISSYAKSITTDDFVGKFFVQFKNETVEFHC